MQALKENGEFTDEVVTQLAVMAECVIDYYRVK